MLWWLGAVPNVLVFPLNVFNVMASTALAGWHIFFWVEGFLVGTVVLLMVLLGILAFPTSVKRPTSARSWLSLS